MRKSKLFVCYSTPLMKFLTNNGIRYEVVGLNPDSKKTFWIFIRDDNLNYKLDDWNKNNPNKE